MKSAFIISIIISVSKKAKVKMLIRKFRIPAQIIKHQLVQNADFFEKSAKKVTFWHPRALYI